MLTLSGCTNITDQGLLGILTQNGDKLKELDLSRTNITGAGLTGFHAPQLENLIMPECLDLTDCGLLELLTNNNDKLKELDFTLAKITGAGLKCIKL